MGTKSIDIVVEDIVANRSKDASKESNIKAYISKSELYQALVKRGVATNRGFTLQESTKNINIYEIKENF